MGIKGSCITWQLPATILKTNLKSQLSRLEQFALSCYQVFLFGNHYVKNSAIERAL